MGQSGSVSSQAKTRLDKWLWAVRVYKTRSMANEACSSGRVRVNGSPAKPATKISVGDKISARRGDRRLELEVLCVIEKRVGAPKAVECYRDDSPPVERAVSRPDDVVVAERRRGDGRPTKRDRRAMDRLRRESRR